MYRSVIAAVTMTAAALLLAPTPAIADDFWGPSHVCGKEVTGVLRLKPFTIWTTDGGCAKVDFRRHHHHHQHKHFGLF
ncbi:hypothetical protein AB0K18_25610 [Nonomuraea sp. NPDC049421]|uniref:hypothetical protein n=1 Tax=Nonomuraea sp. NPDC049421 TaxID=3155275 RepID=UPI003447FA3B